ncbi:hypothetical protein J1N35_007215 [Gossypium stocksii]|uniref:DUF4283 domain-containing protein n=1 Tax=Gossypium stocksii TaxID=47602 RepID=A0A9D3W751_9ROSI|nr:hypothetical protein J1N35_007215 [Gossypium stocksii]
MRAISLLDKVISNKEIKVGLMIHILRNAWPKEFYFESHVLGKNMCLFVFKNDRDKAKVLSAIPLLVLNCHLMLKKRPKKGGIEDIDFNTTKFWLQIHNVPEFEAYPQDESFISKLFTNPTTTGKREIIIEIEDVEC